MQGRLVVLAGCVVAVGCGSPDPVSLHDTARGGHAHGVSVGGGAGAGADSGADSGAGAGAGATPHPTKCADEGSPCSADSDCCAGECSGTCGATGTICAGGGEPCMSGGDCCSGLCDPEMAACY